MATTLKRLEFKLRYSEMSQGLFIVFNEKHLPRDQKKINLGRTVSDALCDVPVQDRSMLLLQILRDAVATYDAVTLTHPEVLFLPGFHLDVVGTLRMLSRNRKICMKWPGIIQEGHLLYASPGNPEYYECDPSTLMDTYIIID